MTCKFLIVALSTIAIPSAALADDACAVPAIDTVAEVTTSYGAEYKVRTTYRSANDLVTQFVNDTTTTLAVEGPDVWVQSDSSDNIGGDAERRFSLGHQYHAMLMHFDDIMENVRPATDILFNGEIHQGRIGNYPTGGEISLVDGTADNQPAGLVMLLPDESPITITYGDWRMIASGTVSLPHQVVINHDENIFTYNYTTIDIELMDAIDMQQRYVAPDLDRIKIHRLHRSLLGAHCRGDAAMMADLSSPSTIIANRGEITMVTQEEMRSTFTTVFENVEYSAYRDIETPIIRVADSGDIGWAVVNVLTEGQEKASGREFSHEWAWVMLAEKRDDGVWVHSGNASNTVPVE